MSPDTEEAKRRELEKHVKELEMEIRKMVWKRVIKWDWNGFDMETIGDMQIAIVHYAMKLEEMIRLY